MARAGFFWDRVTFQRIASTTDVYGNTTGDWSTHAIRYAHIIERLWPEDIEQDASQDFAVATMRVRADAITKAITTVERVVIYRIYWIFTSIKQIISKGDLLEMRLDKGIAACNCNISF